MAVGLRSIDAYNYYPCLNNLVFAYLGTQRATGRPPEEPGADQDRIWLPEAGLARIQRPAYTAIVGTSKGGVLKVFDRQTGDLLLSDCGYVADLAGGGRAASQFLDHGRRVTVTDDRIEVETAFMGFSRPVMTPWRFLAFRVFTLTVGRIGGVGRWLKRLLVKVPIYRRKPLRIILSRTIRFGPDQVTVDDRIEGPDGGRVVRLRWTEAFSTIHMGSARYFVPHELDEPHCDPPAALVSGTALRDGVALSRTIRVGRRA